MCKEEKSIEDFTKDYRKLYGRGYRCTVCNRKRYKLWRDKNLQDLRDRERVRYWDRNRVNKLKRKRPYNKERRKQLLNPKKEKSRSLFRYAVKIGQIVRKPCEVCGKPRAEGHHSDYNKPLEVMWLCRIHHAEWHRNNKAVEPKEQL